MPKTSGSCMYIIFIYFLSHPGTWLSAARACACLRGIGRENLLFLSCKLEKG